MDFFYLEDGDTENPLKMFLEDHLLVNYLVNKA